MGFSVSGSFAVIAIGTFIAVGMFYGAASNGAEKVTESQGEEFDDRLEQQNTALNITKATYDTSVSTDPFHLTIEIKNKGSTALTVNDTDYIVDNEFVSHNDIRTNDFSSEEVDGDSSTDLWLPGETLTVVISVNIIDNLDPTDATDTPERVKVVTGPGLADSRGVTVV